jgi:hypothetical protein
MESSESSALIEIAKQWLSHFEKLARRRKYELLPSLMHEKVVWMGLESNICATLTQTIEREFKELWPKQIAFTFDLARAALFPDSASIVILLPWTASGIIAGSRQKSGRAMITLGIFDNNKKVLCVNGHFSLNPITRITK